MQPANPSERELQALKVIWQLGSATVRDICDAFLVRGDELAYTTVLSLLQTMEQKGLVGHEAKGKVYFYHAKVERERTFRSLASGFLESVFDGAMDEYLVHALESRKVSAAEFERLETLLSKARQSRKREKGESS